MNVKSIGLTVAIVLFLGSGGWVVTKTISTRANALPSCTAGPGEICPSDDFKEQLKTFKALAERQRVLSQNPKLKELISVIDQQSGMGDRMQKEINITLQANPGHAWDGTKEKFVVAPAQPAPTPAPAAVPPAKK